jgi:serine protease Do
MKASNMNKLLIALFLLMLPGKMFSQHLNQQTLEINQQALENSVHLAVKKAYSSSVRIWSFDTLRNVRTGQQFTGVVVSKDGHILTAAHVNTPGETYQVKFPDGIICIAKGLGEIEFSENKMFPDVAMMKIINPGKWPFAEMARSADLRINEPCISIAYPESLNQVLPTIRFGYVTNVKNEVGFIQSTCIMEPGDSGGPLFDYLGRVIGLHSAVDVSEKDNFDVPIDLYLKYWTSLNEEVTYTALPAKEDLLKADPLSSKILTLSSTDYLESAFKKPASLLKENCYLIKSNINGKEQTVLGTLFELGGGILVSKSSLVGTLPMVRLGSNRYVSVKVISRNSENDLVFLQTEGKIKGGIKLNPINQDTVKFEDLGSFLISPQSEGKYSVSVLGSLEFSLPKITSRGYLGAKVAFFGPLLINDIEPNSPASESKLESGDELLTINGVPVKQRAAYLNVFNKYWPGDHVKFSIMRSGKVLEKEVVLVASPQTVGHHQAELFKGGKSIRRDGFNKVFVHDATLQPDQCGGPVFDANGRFYGINIARFSRSSTVVIPAKIIFDLMEKYKS